jgi:hypothetical protein
MLPDGFEQLELDLFPEVEEKQKEKKRESEGFLKEVISDDSDYCE